MNTRHSHKHWWLTLACTTALAAPAAAIEVVPWTVSSRDGVLMQEDDLSCGAAAIAMVLNSLYRQDTTEAEVLKAMGTQGIAANVNQMLRGIESMGYTGRALSLGFDELAKLSVPVILFIKPPLSLLDMGHFVVLTRVTSAGVTYRDPSFGHRVLAENDFRRYWETRADKTLPGIAIAVLPKTAPQREAAQAFAAPVVTPAAPLLPHLR